VAVHPAPPGGGEEVADRDGEADAEADRDADGDAEAEREADGDAEADRDGDGDELVGAADVLGGGCVEPLTRSA
jgi:hypothetical protein